VKNSPGRACPVPGWVFIVALLLGEFSLWAWLTRAGVARGWWSDLAGGLMFLALPFLLRGLVVFTSYRFSRANGVKLAESQMLRGAAWWKFFLVEYAHFCRQAFLQLPFPVFFRTRSDRGSGAASGPVIVLQHGYAHNGAVWFSTARALEKRGYRVFTIDQPLYAPIDVMADRLAARIHDVLARTGESQITLIAHSMGGLVSRAYLRKYGEAKVQKLITLGSPHRGTLHAWAAGGTNGKQMRPGSQWLRTLNQTTVSIPFISLYSVHDTVITPQDSSRVAGAINIELQGMGHVAMPSGKRMREQLFAALDGHIETAKPV
jgi:triacylglycerol lipase